MEPMITCLIRKYIPSRFFTLIISLMVAVLLPDRVLADELSSGDTAWMLTATVLVLFMTLPGLALFYGGLARSKNVISILMQCFAIACLASFLWVIGLYSLAFSEGNALIGDFKHLFLMGISVDELNGGTFSETIFVMFQMTFAIITPALIVGAFVERMKFAAVLLFTSLWLLIVYAPVAHWVWAGTGWMFNNGTIDLAGGLVVHITAGISALILAKMLGPRLDFPDKLHPPHHPVLVMVGACMLWVGWFGFNAGSAAASNGSAGMALLVTQIATATAAFTWMIVEWIKVGKPTAVGVATGAVAGLVAITPASGSAGPMGALLIGAASGLVCYFCATSLKKAMGYDDSLDVFGVHGIGGIVGALLTGFCAAEGMGGAGLGDGISSTGAQVFVQFKSVLVTVIWSAVVSFIAFKVAGILTGGCRVSDDEEDQGLDLNSHGESGYSS